MLKRKGAFTDNAGAALIFVFTVLFITLLVQGKLVKTDAQLKVQQAQLDAVDLAYMAQECLGDRDGVIDTIRLKGASELGDVAGQREMCRRRLFIRVSDTTSMQQWTLGTAGGKFSHEIFVPLRVGGETRVGRLYVSV